MACFEYYAGLGEKLDTSREKDVDVGDSSFRCSMGPCRVAVAATPPTPHMC